MQMLSPCAATTLQVNLFIDDYWTDYSLRFGQESLVGH